MAKFTQPEDIVVPQSVGPRNSTKIANDTKYQVFEPTQGRSLTYYDPLYPDFPTYRGFFSVEIKGTEGGEPGYCEGAQEVLGEPLEPQPDTEAECLDPNNDNNESGIAGTWHESTEEMAKFQILVNGEVIDSKTSEAEYTSYEYLLNLGKEPTFSDVVEIIVRYYNDAGGYLEGDEGEVIYDRNLYVQSITIDHVNLGPTTYSTQTGTDLPEGMTIDYYRRDQNNYYYVTQWTSMPWDGDMIFKIPVSYFDLLIGDSDGIPTYTTKISEDLDHRASLGTYTLNNRDFWEENNFNESILQPYLTEEYKKDESYKLKINDTRLLETQDGPVVLPYTPYYETHPGSSPYNEYNITKFSVDVLPFVINPDNDDIIPLDRYYDKYAAQSKKVTNTDTLEVDAYYLASEGKINLKFEKRFYGRIWQEYYPEMSNNGHSVNNFGANIDIFKYRGSDKNYFDNTIINNPGETDGCYLFKLNWDDGSILEFTDDPKLLESTVMFEHYYANPGFYKITGVVYRIQRGRLKTWEKFETNILLNPSQGFDYGLFDYDNFATIGGISKHSAMLKSLYNMMGAHPITGRFKIKDQELLKDYNELDVLKILDTLGKVDYSNDFLQSFGTFLSPYQGEIDDTITYVFGCTDDRPADTGEGVSSTNNLDIDGNEWVDGATGYIARNYNPNATVDDGSCLYDFFLNVYTAVAGAEMVQYGQTTSVDVIDVDGNSQELFFPESILSSTGQSSGIIDAGTDIDLALDYTFSGQSQYADPVDPDIYGYYFRGWFNMNDFLGDDPNYDELMGDFSEVDFDLTDKTPVIEPGVDMLDQEYDTLDASNKQWSLHIEQNWHLVAIWEYQDVFPPNPVRNHTTPFWPILKLSNTDDNYQIPFNQLRLKFKEPVDQGGLYSVDHFEIWRLASDGSDGAPPGILVSPIPDTDDYVYHPISDANANEVFTYDTAYSDNSPNFFNRDQANALDINRQYLYSVYAVDDVGNKSTVRPTDWKYPTEDIAPHMPDPISISSTSDGNRFVWSVYNNDNETLIVGEGEDDFGIQNFDQYNMPVGDFSHYRVKRTTVTGASSGVEVYFPMTASSAQPQTINAVNNNVLFDENVEIGEEYEYQVQSLDIAGNSLGYTEKLTIGYAGVPSLGNGAYYFLYADNITKGSDDQPLYPAGIIIRWDDLWQQGWNEYAASRNYDNFMGFEIQKRSNEPWTRSGMVIQPDEDYTQPFMNQVDADNINDGVDWGPGWYPMGDFVYWTSATYPGLIPPGFMPFFPAAVPAGHEYAGPDSPTTDFDLVNGGDGYSDTEGDETADEGHYMWKMGTGVGSDAGPNLTIGDYQYPPRNSSGYSYDFSNYTYDQNNEFSLYDDGWEDAWGTLELGATYWYRIRLVEREMGPETDTLIRGNWYYPEPHQLDGTGDNYDSTSVGEFDPANIGNGAPGVIFGYEVDPTTYTAPVLSPIAVSSFDPQNFDYSSGTWSTDVIWTTDENATSVVDMTGGPYNADNNNEPDRVNHSVNITGLTREFIYYYTVTSTDLWGNSITSEEYSFSVPATPFLVAFDMEMIHPDLPVAHFNMTMTEQGDPPPPLEFTGLNVDFPIGGQTFNFEDTLPIQWDRLEEFADAGILLDISLHNADVGQNSPDYLIENIASDIDYNYGDPAGTFPWTIPTAGSTTSLDFVLIENDQYMIRIMPQLQGDIAAWSDVFTILAPEAAGDGEPDFYEFTVSKFLVGNNVLGDVVFSQPVVDPSGTVLANTGDSAIAATDPNPLLLPSGYTSTTIRLTAVPGTDSMFDYWMADGTGDSTSPHRELILGGSIPDNQRNKHTNAFFQAGTAYILTLNSSGNGSVSPAGSTSLAAGAGVNIIAVPAEGWVFNNWTPASAVSNNGGNPNNESTSITMPTSNVNLTANFTADVPTYQLTIDNNGGGQVELFGDGTYAAGTVVEIEAYTESTPDWYFENWSGSDLITNVLQESTTITMPASNVNLTANFGMGA